MKPVRPHPTLTDAEVEAQGGFVERLADDGASAFLIAIAPHGGWIERFTDMQAERLRDALAGFGASSWLCRGHRPGGGAYASFHVPSTDIDEASFPLLGRVLGRGFAHAVAFHGHDVPGVLIGGSAPEAQKLAVKAAIEVALAGAGVAVRVADASCRHAGESPRNVVNRLAPGGGLQIEQCMRARQSHWAAIADAVASVYLART
ncbi:poly-gamma-glutamate hydrolase family protein [Polyangium aurulentum]|uniref:poly-gamma-glutamate hydrolase family protein n=1 Tax=Polyangium aurulentum TaxID=2567896 RepID=UPI0010AE2A00|nr:poly-gamma-glutamate hydrolase family protein [Polyangium aurulentum]UQA54622.1 poly-gamma-glutamate hydrolase family protein [Polyangium aurulentum]